eukprot:11689567-Ditylum_brightwellii.AAC.1
MKARACGNGSTHRTYVSKEEATSPMAVTESVILTAAIDAKKDIESIDFVVNPFDICATDKIVDGKQQTITWHIDDIKASHVDPKVNDQLFQWSEATYESNLNGHIGCLMIDMKYYILGMLEEFPYK